MGVRWGPDAPGMPGLNFRTHTHFSPTLTSPSPAPPPPTPARRFEEGEGDEIQELQQPLLGGDADGGDAGGVSLMSAARRKFAGRMGGLGGLRGAKRSPSGRRLPPVRGRIAQALDWWFSKPEMGPARPRLPGPPQKIEPKVDVGLGW